MEEQIFVDGVGMITIIGGTVRLDLVSFSASEKDAKGQPALVFRQRLVLGVDGFMRMAEKIQESATTLSRLAQQQQRPAVAAAPEAQPVAVVPAPPAAPAPTVASPAPASPAPAATKPPFP